jgi:hypothetical protein
LVVGHEGRFGVAPPEGRAPLRPRDARPD